MAGRRVEAYNSLEMSHGEPIHPKPPLGVREKRLESRFPALSEIEVSWVDGSGGVRTDNATVMDHSDNGLGLKTLTRFPDGLMLWMRDVDGELVKAVVRFSRNHELGDWQTGVRVVPRDQRAYARDPVHGMAELKWSGAGGRTISKPVKVVDLSDGGVGIVAHFDLSAGQSVQLIGDQFECFCSVRNCRDLGDGSFRLGLLFAREPYDRVHGLAADWVD